MLKAVLFDLDGTLIPMNEKQFTEYYFGLLLKRFVPLGYDKDDLVKTVWNGTGAMLKNDGKETNETVFWRVFTDRYGRDKSADKAVFDDFYVTDFKKAKVMCGENPDARMIIDYVKSKGLKVILASNPVFPICGLLTRAGFTGLNKDDFDYVTGYENSHYAKPNPKYLEEILKVNGLEKDEVLYFGNSETDDIAPAKAVGVNYFHVTDKCLKLSDVTSIIK